MRDVFETYLLELKKAYAEGGTEQTGRPALKALLDAFAVKEKPLANVQHEPKHVPDKGAPDFRVSRQGMILGYVENKGIGENLDKVLKSDQIKRYLSLSENILLTDYLHFIWINNDGIKRETLCHATDLENPKYILREDRVVGVGKLLDGFFSTPPEGISKAEQLALALATRSRLLRDYLGDELLRQQREHKEGRLYGLFETFRTQVFHELTVSEFADAFAQMLAYGLFLAKLNAGEKEVDLHNVKQFVPGSFRLIRELADFLDVLENDPYRDIRWVVEEILSMTNSLNLAAIHEDLSFRHRKVRRGVKAKSEEEARLFERDPFVYFYEDYLSLYDPKLRETRGVYYTPPPVVNFIARAVDEIIKNKDVFGIADGLADHNQVTVLDFACGTGTFLLEVFERIFENIGGPESGKADLVVRDHMLKNIYGFEYLIAPYTIAHLKLSQYLDDRGHALSDAERLLIYLTNTLEPIDPQKNLLLPELTREVAAAQEVKERPILVIMGNPPYSRHSRNMGAFARGSVQAYKEGFPELDKPGQGKGLQDDYVKFIRFAQMKMDAVKEGIVGIITNHSYLDNPTFKGMRKSLMQTFDKIYVLDLHGNKKKKERTPAGGEDQNVFDIQQGVAIAFFVKKPGCDKGVWHSDLWGSRQSKYEACVSTEFSKFPWQQIDPVAPLYLYRPWDQELAVTYQKFWSVPEIFAPVGDPAPGVVTTHDEFAISFTPEEATSKVKALLKTSSEEEARSLFRLCSQSQWSYSRAKEQLSDIDIEKATVSLVYRPFDNRWTVWDRNVAVHRRERVMTHMLQSNLALLTARSNKSPDPDHFFVSDRPSETKAAESTTQSYLFPLFLYSEKNGRSENFSSDFRAFIDGRYDRHYTPEEILSYIYAVFYAPSYRALFTEFLRVDFPRVPFPEDAADFETLAELGWELVQVHLLREQPRSGLALYSGKGDHMVETVRYSTADEAIWINETQCFKPVPQDIWDFSIGGYPILDKYLKYRRERNLTLGEINRVSAVAESLGFTIEQMDKIEDAYLSAFPDLG